MVKASAPPTMSGGSTDPFSGQDPFSSDPFASIERKDGEQVHVMSTCMMYMYCLYHIAGNVLAAYFTDCEFCNLFSRIEDQMTTPLYTVERSFNTGSKVPGVNNDSQFSNISKIKRL